MSPLSSDLRNILERAVIKAREIAEEAATVALKTLAVMNEEPFAFMNTEQRRLRNALRAKARQLGDGDLKKGWQALIEEVAYEQWHNRLFTCFLAENNLLMHPEGVAVTLDECAELAAEIGDIDAWQLAAQYASAMLPGIFRVDDPAMQIQFSPEGRHKLEYIITNLPAHLFTMDDALGWSYQFWQTKKKEEVNKSGQKIGGRDISPVTQLFTEHYMVQFLLENSLGAWWAARHPTSTLLKEYPYLRYQESGIPAAGTFPFWPEHIADLTVMDPCCGSGHFLVAAFEMLYQMRMEEEGLCEAQSVDAVLKDNLFGLELDARCTQIATFALALTAWKKSGYRQLPLPNIACSGIAVAGQLETWTKMAGDDINLTLTLERHYKLFSNAPHLGSLINPNNVPLQDRMFSTEYELVEPLLSQALANENKDKDPVSSVFGTAATGAARAAKLLAKTYTLVVTNVPYLGRNKQDEILINFCDANYPDSKDNLATTFIDRCKSLTTLGGSYGLVTPQNWLFLKNHYELRRRLLVNQTWNHLSILGSGAFETISGEVVNTILIIMTNQLPKDMQTITGIDVSKTRVAQEKARLLVNMPLQQRAQSLQLQNPEARVSLHNLRGPKLLAEYATVHEGMSRGDTERFDRKFWEVLSIDENWSFLLNSPQHSSFYSGRENIVFWEQGKGELANSTQARITGRAAWGKRGVFVARTNDLKCTLSLGEKHAQNGAVLLPKKSEYLPAIWAYCFSTEYREAVKRLSDKIIVASGTLNQVPFDLDYWQQIADASGPLTEPYSNDPTQWLFDGSPVNTIEPLQVAMARLLDYSWPQQKHDVLDTYNDKGHIICLPSAAGENTAVERLRSLLAIAYGDVWSAALQNRLLQDAGFGGKSLDAWLRDGFFAQHCRLFHNRPFIWHIWDGRKDGFSALINYHYLDAAGLDRLIYTYLGSWISKQRDERDAKVAGAEARLVAALELQKKLEAIRDGEPPYDIYVRWKPLHEQPIGWDPDLNDGIRLNIRPFVEAGVLRNRFTINWNKDRGKNPDGNERLNDLHYALAQKYEARADLQ